MQHLFATHAQSPSLVVLDDFYLNPLAVRNFALQQPFEPGGDLYKGLRTSRQFLAPSIRARFEAALGLQITSWDDERWNGVFSLGLPEHLRVFHSDAQTHAATIYLHPDPPASAGLQLHRSRTTRLRQVPTRADEVRLGRSRAELTTETYQHKLLDPTAWETLDQIGNLWNRCVIWNAQLIHSAAAYFGHSPETARLVQLFFFNAKTPDSSKST